MMSLRAETKNGLNGGFNFYSMIIT